MASVWSRTMVLSTWPLACFTQCCYEVPGTILMCNL